jgi:23S rRNA (guanosine2251-2'-O)-methyltransferase
MVIQIEGRNPVYEALHSDTDKVIQLYIQGRSASSPKVRSIISIAKKQGIRIRKVSSKRLDRMSHTRVHQGVIAKVRKEKVRLIDIIHKLDKKKADAFFVMFNEVLYQQNLGAIIRTAECAGCNGVIIPLKTKITAEAVRAAMGGTEHIPLINENFFNAIKILRDNAVKIVCLDVTGRKSIYEENLTGPLAFIVGGEDRGISRTIVDKCDIVLNIPIFGKINSLNMSNAAAVALYEKVRQEQYS